MECRYQIKSQTDKDLIIHVYNYVCVPNKACIMLSRGGYRILDTVILLSILKWDAFVHLRATVFSLSLNFRSTQDSSPEGFAPASICELINISSSSSYNVQCFYQNMGKELHCQYIEDTIKLICAYIYYIIHMLLNCLGLHQVCSLME